MAVSLLFLFFILLLNPTFGILLLGLVLYGAYSFNLPNQF
jgi:hypothetical protein